VPANTTCFLLALPGGKAIEQRAEDRGIVAELQAV
jgi:hypothetical protein